MQNSTPIGICLSIIFTVKFCILFQMTFNYIREPRSTEVDHTYIMKYSPSFFCGCFWLGNMYVLQTFTTAYKKQVKVLLEEGLANCDEQVRVGNSLNKPKNFSKHLVYVTY